jgi:hypothetical protein
MGLSKILDFENASNLNFLWVHFVYKVYSHLINPHKILDLLIPTMTYSKTKISPFRSFFSSDF